MWKRRTVKKSKISPKRGCPKYVQRLGLLNMQEAFVEMYLWWQNPNDVGRAVGSSEKLFHAIVNKLLTKANIHTRIYERLAEMKMAANEVYRCWLIRLVQTSIHQGQCTRFFIVWLHQTSRIKNTHPITLPPCPDPNINVGSVFWGQVRWSSCFIRTRRFRSSSWPQTLFRLPR